MRTGLPKLIDRLSAFFAPRKGLLPTLGLAIIIVNWILVMLTDNWFTSTNFLLHLGLVIVIIGFLLAWAL